MDQGLNPLNISQHKKSPTGSYPIGLIQTELLQSTIFKVFVRSGRCRPCYSFTEITIPLYLQSVLAKFTPHYPGFSSDTHYNDQCFSIAAMHFLRDTAYALIFLFIECYISIRELCNILCSGGVLNMTHIIYTNLGSKIPRRQYEPY